uniref:Uncharacterized protein n=1 Tax=Pristionchus pacificus TaxID=54126 RepID=A0A8R1US90_PRIPA
MFHACDNPFTLYQKFRARHGTKSGQKSIIREDFGAHKLNIDSVKSKMKCLNLFLEQYGVAKDILVESFLIGLLNACRRLKLHYATEITAAEIYAMYTCLEKCRKCRKENNSFRFLHSLLTFIHYIREGSAKTISVDFGGTTSELL